MGRGQALVEFATTIGVFLLMLLGAVEASLYTLERAAAVTAVAAGARVAAGGSDTGVNEPDLVDATATVVRLATPAIPASWLRSLPPGRPCPALPKIPRGEVDVCAVQEGRMVTVTLRGWPAALIPDAFGLGWPLEVAAEVHTVTFGP